ncbi:hypothetical protein A2U01_0056750 [Trifolium medium]|uniref:Uncharacterized protein n=1 Tax=Trifolium medium TaxID=97028 RepID=A0A392RH03_9FABA|nr:hypothetical protein [Trifolium medium]
MVHEPPLHVQPQFQHPIRPVKYPCLVQLQPHVEVQAHVELQAEVEHEAQPRLMQLLISS